MQVATSLVPIFAVIALGIVLRRGNYLTREMTQGFNWFAYFWALPLFLFYKLGTAASGDPIANTFIVALLAATLLTLIASWIAASAMKLAPASKGAFVQASFRGNLAFIGLPLILFTIEGLTKQEMAQLETTVLLTLPPVVIFYNAAAVAILALYNQSASETFSWKIVLRNIALNPLLMACVGGMLIQKSGFPMPTVIERTCMMVGAAAFPLALVGIGSQMATLKVSQRWLEPMLTSIFKSVLCPVLGWLLGIAWGLEKSELQMFLILCAVPTAVSGFVLADQMRADADLAASAVVLGTAFSFVPLSILLAIPF